MTLGVNVDIKVLGSNPAMYQCDFRFIYVHLSDDVRTVNEIVMQPAHMCEFKRKKLAIRLATRHVPSPEMAKNGLRRFIWPHQMEVRDLCLTPLGYRLLLDFPANVILETTEPMVEFWTIPAQLETFPIESSVSQCATELMQCYSMTIFKIAICAVNSQTGQGIRASKKSFPTFCDMHYRNCKTLSGVIGAPEPRWNPFKKLEKVGQNIRDGIIKAGPAVEVIGQAASIVKPNQGK
ncbi:Cecropin-A [Papilio machaon]|uniref:Cecropin-A n=1 Tax=Papilio machaon TaxID=76193 RepID=A0A0N0PAL1_PAPMA|nr:Cecropin-A [Papilio machaon]